MKVFVIANPKGGSGKSTVATNLAGYFAGQGRDVMLGDIDRQQSSREWLGLRPFEASPISTWNLREGQVARPPEGTTHAVLDTPAGLQGKMLERVVKLPAKILIPVQPSLFDMRATRSFVQLLQAEKAYRKGRISVAVIGMRVDLRTRAAAELERFFESLALPVLTYLRDTQLYVQATVSGLTIFDLPPSRAERDLDQWAPIIEWAESA